MSSTRSGLNSGTQTRAGEGSPVSSGRPGVSGRPRRDGRSADSPTDQIALDPKETIPIGFPDGKGSSDHNVNDYVQPNIPVQSRVMATLRLRLTAQRITEGDNMTPSDFNRIRSHVEQRLKKQKPVVTDNKDGVTTSYIADDSGWAFYMEDQGRTVAVLDVGFHKHIYGSYVDAPYRQRGYSTSLYLCAIRILGELKSDDSLGTSALRTWKSVARYHKVELLDYNTDKSVNFEWGPDAMPLLGSKKVPLTKVPLIYFFKASRGE